VASTDPRVTGRIVFPGGLRRVARGLQIATVGKDVEPTLVAVRELRLSKLDLLPAPDVNPVLRDPRRYVATIKVPVDASVVKAEAAVRVMEVVAQVVRKEMPQADEVFFSVSSVPRCSPPKTDPPPL